MTHTHFKSEDQIVEVVTTTDDHRYPRHSAKMTIIKLKPRAHSRCRPQWGGLTLMLRFDELRAIAEAIQSCDPDFHFTMQKDAKNKPESRREWWEKQNQQRVEAKRAYSRR